MCADRIAMGAGRGRGNFLFLAEGGPIIHTDKHTHGQYAIYTLPACEETLKKKISLKELAEKLEKYYDFYLF